MPIPKSVDDKAFHPRYRSTEASAMRVRFVACSARGSACQGCSIAVRVAAPRDAVRYLPVASEVAGDPPRINASPMARAMARKLGVDLHVVRGSGPGGRVVSGDIEATAQGRSHIPAAASPVIDFLGAQGDVERIPMTNLRRVAARRLVQSIQTTPHVYLTRDVDAEKLTALRADHNRRFAASGENLKVTFTDVLVKACAMSLQVVPDLNVSWAGDGLLRHLRVNIGIAVATDAGLVVPVVGDADRKSVRQISLETKRLINAARDGKLALSELSGGTFTISNLGMHGVEQFTSVINPPEAALLSVGTVLPRVVAFEGAAAVRQVFTITLAIDHRAVDGATGAMFLERLVGLFEDPGHIFTQ